MKRPTVLIAEDDEFLLQMLRMALESEGFTAVGARDGAAALQSFRATRPDVMMVDVCMPHLDGWGVLRAVSAESHGRMPVAMMSASGVRLTPPDDLHGHAQAVLQKPFSLSTVVQVVRMLAPGRGEAHAAAGLVPDAPAI